MDDVRARRSWTTRLVALALASTLLALFVAENFSLVEVRLFVVKERMRLAWALLISGALGFAVGYFTERMRRR